MYVCELRVHTLSEVGARSVPELVILSRVRRRDLARSFRDMARSSDSRIGSSKATWYS